MPHPIKALALAAMGVLLATRPLLAQTDEPAAPPAAPLPGPAAGPADPKNSSVGDVVYSILPPELFEQTHAGRWALLDGADLAPDTGLYKFLEKQGRLDLLSKDEGPVKLFDARGVFLRGLNLARDPKQGDPAGAARAVGSQQGDQVGRHRHDATVFTKSQRTGLASQDRFTAPRWDDGGLTRQTGYSDTASETDVETRPANIALYVYVKIGTE